MTDEIVYQLLAYFGFFDLILKTVGTRTIWAVGVYVPKWNDSDHFWNIISSSN